jgi:hypothetical protein
MENKTNNRQGLCGWLADSSFQSEGHVSVWADVSASLFSLNSLNFIDVYFPGKILERNYFLSKYHFFDPPALRSIFLTRRRPKYTDNIKV